MAASAPCHNATLFDLQFAHSTSSLFKPMTTSAVGDSFVGGQHRSIADACLSTWGYQRESGWFLEAQCH